MYPPAPDLGAALRGRSQEQRLRTGVNIGIGAKADGVDAQKVLAASADGVAVRATR